jgi:hypothetical protein
MSCSIRLLRDGAGGLAFDIADAGEFCAFLVRAEAGGSLRYELALYRDGKPQVLWTAPCALEMDQWAQIELEKQGAVVFPAADGRRLAAVELPDETDGRAVGLFAGEGGGALFTAVKCREVQPTQRFSYVFEPPGDYTALACWRQVEGKFAVKGHPGRLAIAGGETHRARLAWRLPVDSPIEVQVTVKETAARPQPKRLIPDLPMPALPDDPRIGLAFVPDGAPENALSVSTDALRMQGLKVQQGDRILLDETSPPTAPGEDREKTLVLRLDASSLTVSAGGCDEKSATLESKEVRGTLEVFAENLPDSSVEVTHILIRKKPASAAASSTPGR